MTPEEFLALFPEFAGAGTDLIQTRLTWAEARTPEGIWGDLREQGIATMAAHFLSQLPEAKEMRLGEKPGESMYGRQRAHLNKIVSSGFRVAGIPSALE